MRLRLTFSKTGLLIYTSHLDLMRVWERALRRAGAPLAYSQGFNPRPKLQLAAALPLGHAAQAEMIDVWLEQDVPLPALAGRLAQVFPAGLAVHDVTVVPEDAPALQTLVRAMDYRVTVPWEGSREQLERRVADLLAAETLPLERRGKPYDLRPLVEQLWVDSVAEDEVVLEMQLAARPGATGRAEAVLEALGLDQEGARFCRLGLGGAWSLAT